MESRHQCRCLLASTLFVTSAAVLYVPPPAAAESGQVVTVAALPEVLPGPGGGTPDSLVPLGEDVYFRYRSGSQSQLWRMPASGAPIRVTGPGTPPPTSAVGSIVAMGGAIYFTATDSATGRSDLWRTGGPSATTQRLIQGGTASPIDDLTVVGGTLFFAMADPTHGRELWRSDGSPGGTARVADIGPGAADGSPENLTPFGDRIAFTALPDAATGDGYREVFVSDGSAAGTIQVTADSVEDPYGLASVGGSLYFTYDDGIHGRELWASTGTAAGTSLVVDLAPLDDSSNPYDMTAVGSAVYFTATTGAGRQLWTSGGTAASTRPVTHLAPGSQLGTLRAAPGGLYFGVRSGDGPVQLHRLGTRDGRVTQLTRFEPADTGLDQVLVSGNRVWFSAADTSHGMELWSSQGTPGDTSMVRDLVPGADWSAPTSFVADSRGLLFVASTPGTGDEIWRATAAPAPVAHDQQVARPVVWAVGRQKQRRRAVRVKVNVGAAEPVTATLTGSVRFRNRTRRLRSATVRVSPGPARHVTLTGSRKVRRAVNSVLTRYRAAHGAKKKWAVRAKVKVTLRDAAGNSFTRTVRVRLT